MVSTNPASSSTGVAINQTITATFLQDSDSTTSALDCSTLTAATFTLTSAAGPVTGTVACTGAHRYLYADWISGS